MTMVARLITHSGPFHADDVLVYAILSDLHPGAALTRTRDAVAIAAARETGDAIIFDVGDIHDPARGSFDHHQQDRPLRPSGLPFSSFGLVWTHFGRAWLRTRPGLAAETADTLEHLHHMIEHDLVRAIDALDNGFPDEADPAAFSDLALPALLALFRPSDGIPETPDSDAETLGFRDAAAMAGTVLDRWAAKSRERLDADRMVSEALACRPDRRWIELSHGLRFPGQDLANRCEELLYAVLPGRGEWQIAAVNTVPGSFDLRQPLPRVWAGLRDGHLADATGVEDAVFCHSERFCAFAKSRDGAMALLDQALAHAA